MNLEDLGYYSKLEKFRSENNLNEFETGRVVEEHKERYKVLTVNGEYEAEIPVFISLDGSTKSILLVDNSERK